MEVIRAVKNKKQTHMIRLLLPMVALLLWLQSSTAQVSCLPVFPSTDSDVTITFNATQGNGALNNIIPVFAHMGVITNLSTSPSDWKYVQTTWGVADPDGSMTFVSPNVWSKSFNIRQFFGVPANETVLQLAFVFRNTDGSTVGRAADGGDIFYAVFPNDGQLRTRIIQPANASLVVAPATTSIAVNAAASLTGDLKLLDNGVQVFSTTGTSLNHTLATAPGLHNIEFVANTSNDTDTSRFVYIMPSDVPPQDPPAGTQLGINHINNSTVRLALFAPGKSSVFLIGDMNDWTPEPAYQLKKSLDGNTWWIELTNLTPGADYRFQYLVDGAIKIADPLSTLVLDPWNDGFVPPLTFPYLLPYPTGKTTGVVSWLQPGKAPFNWQTTNYTRPTKSNLVVYELLLRDFVARHDYNTLLDTLDYLDRLGVTAIELMPVNEFDNNISWGYSPSFHKALDKYYGTPEQFKQFVDACHARGIAVIVDAVFNHATGLSPLAQLYWDGANNRPAANNPWLNPSATHPFNVFNDFNHESAATKAYTKNCLKYWIEEYKVDGFRFDLSKGFTQKNTDGNVGAWGQYDAARVAIWKDYANFIWSVDPDNYVILEHFADNSEEKELAEYGMMLWGNMWGAYKEVALGYSNGVTTSLAGVNYKARNWTVPHLVGYMESHDEDRIAFECKTYGNQAVGHNVRELSTSMRRIEMLNHLFYTVPGPKMLWQFGEVGYDFPINYCENGSINPDCRTAPKPIRWDYMSNPYRRRLQQVTSALLQLRRQNDVFQTTDYQALIGSTAVRSVVLNGTSMDVVAVANVSFQNASGSVTFPSTGTWYDYYTGQPFEVTTASTNFSLQAAEYRLYTSQFVALPTGINISNTQDAPTWAAELVIAPNPASERFAVQIYVEAATDIAVEVIDTQGRVVANTAPQNWPAGGAALDINCANWSTGIYLVRCTDVLTGQTVTQRIVKH
jgi:glycosidase